ncbi:methionyl-tRNA formyltransferase [Natranaerobius trueperi]|uniref:Methionyl-tRNA formyltransferase n=1 Tax=Natranaerobius trueperi TaxID=759412 RepID=A0A226C0P5_9FIRM|nr:methionyl-tRNA formyltransferase [Natranaerobius trueperi]OWZ84164.1 methionyl-tRNA formyltransferase [Natranaerobius trueperi]
MKIIFMGTPDFAVPILEKLAKTDNTIQRVITQPDRKKGRGKALQPPPVKKCATELGLTVCQPEKVSNQNFIDELKELDPDLIVTAAYGQILPREILEIPNYDAINVHASLLPKYRGAAPIHRAVINGEDITGVTIMKMSEKMDAGDILNYQKILINKNDNSGNIFNKILDVAPSLLVDTVEQFKRDEIVAKKQDDSRATYAPKLTKVDERLNFKDSMAEQIYNQVRGLNPWPGAYTYVRDKRLKVWESELLEEINEHNNNLGSIVAVSDNGPVIQCKSGKIILTKVQLQGKKPISGSDFVRGFHIKENEALN